MAAFLAGQIGFTQIAAVVARTLEDYVPAAPVSLADVLEVDTDARKRAEEMLKLG